MMGCSTSQSCPGEPCLPVMHTRPVHKQYTPAFHPCTVTLPKQGHVPANSSYSTREQLIACIPLPSTHILWRRQAPLNFYQDQITLMTNWHHCTGGEVPLQSNFVLCACLPLFFLKVDVNKMPDLKGKQNKFNLKKTFIWSSFKSHSLTDDSFLPFHISSLHQRPYTLSHGQWDFPIDSFWTNQCLGRYRITF